MTGSINVLFLALHNLALQLEDSVVETVHDWQLNICRGE